ncbi:unnamed protein product [Schistosoma turkestanicum]|nr:unnamed protein product [Schistosoma turkestanicum]
MAQAFDWIGPYANEYERYPSLEFQKQWIHTYLTTFYKNSQLQLNLNHENLQLNDVYTEDDLNKWLQEVNCFALVSHLLWAVWAVICASENLYSMDFLAYADSRMKQYNNMKKWLPSAFQLPAL